MRNICMTVSYDGTAYNGFQIQPIGRTIQGEIEKVIHLLTGETIKIHGSGRTDAGVHARGQVFHFHTGSQIPVERWAIALNSRLPDDIVIQSAEEKHLDFHSRRSAKRKTYRYSIRTGKHPNVFNRHFEFHHYSPLNTEAMRSALSHLVGEHDFTTFTSIHSTKQSHVRTIYEAKLVEEDDVIHTYFTGNGFLYNMVRIIMGTLMKIGEGKIIADDMPMILAACDRSKAGPKAMAHGLILWSVEYEYENFPLTVAEQVRG
ncbi:tRNA pseudouridine(38-40) synthase TruA [Paenibacillus pinihumi]|uniref:tRNA pseudouridine(38-40) synthase TruA n=1 Tax=Paenibacillus pinihumi TaxID=669462 RepID=UPI00040045D5|nr:tRNA pseudouridine(38-40) synthase TruA [Paenibacillus pinihumi]